MATMEEFSYNTSMHGSLGRSPFRRPPPTLLDCVPRATFAKAGKKELIVKDHVMRMLKEKLIKSQNRIKKGL